MPGGSGVTEARSESGIFTLKLLDLIADLPRRIAGVAGHARECKAATRELLAGVPAYGML